MGRRAARSTAPPSPSFPNGSSTKILLTRCYTIFVQKCASPQRDSPKNPKSNLSFWRLPCPPIAPRTVPLCVRLPLPMAASAALWSAAVLPPLSRLKPRPSTPARKPTAITLRALCAPVSVPFVVNLFPRSQALAGEAAGKDIAYHLSGSYVSACDLSSALGRLFPLSPVVVAGLQTRQRDGRERPVSSRGQRSQIPTLSEGACFSPLHPKPCASPSTNTSTPTAPIPGAKPSAPPTNSPPITRRLIPNRRPLSRPQPLLLRQHQTHLPPPNRTAFIPNELL